MIFNLNTVSNFLAGAAGPVIEMIRVNHGLDHEPSLSHHVYDGVVSHEMTGPECEEERRARVVEEEF